MDDHERLLSAIPGLECRVRAAGFEAWLRGKPKVTGEGRTFVVIGGDRLASEAEAMLAFAEERGLVTAGELREASAALPLPDDVEGLAIDLEGES